MFTKVTVTPIILKAQITVCINNGNIFPFLCNE